VGEFVQLEVDAGVGTIRLDRPPMNALNTAMQREIRDAAVEASERAEIRAVVVYGGPKVFAAGADVKEMAGMSYEQMAPHSAVLQDCFTAVARIPKPTIAAVTGFALGGGCELAMCCDLRVAGDNAKLGQPEILLGIIPGAGGTQRLPRLVGPAKAKDLIFTGRFVDAAEALSIGLVDVVTGPDDVYADALALARKLAAGPTFALRAAKEAIDRGLEVDLATGLEIERVQFAALFATQDRQIGMDSFVANGAGKATFTGAPE
jgi:enoyl-CoA hydratase/carnithine racemase